MEDYSTQLKKAFDSLEEIRSISSSKQKAEIMELNLDNYVLKSLLYLAYNPFLTYNIKKIPKYTKNNSDEITTDKNFKDFLELLIKLDKREVTGNNALEEVSNLLSRCSSKEQEWYSKVLQKDLKAGIADKGINKVFKNLVPVYEILLADKIPSEDLTLNTEKALKMLPDRIVCQYKIDGYRLNIFVYDNYVVTRTRNGKMVYGYDDLEKEALEKLPKGFVYDGEMVSLELEDWIHKNEESGEVVEPNRQLFADAVSKAFSKEKNKKGVFNLFDMLPISEWESNSFTESLEVRYNRIHDMLSPLDLETIKVVPTTRVFYKKNPEDREEIVELFQKYINIGWEGIMLKNYDAPYEFKRSKNLLKMKLMKSDDLEVLDVFEGKDGSKYEGMLGGVTVAYPASDGNTYNVSVGSGWSDEERVKYWENPELIVGKLIEVNYQAETQNQDGGYSISFPVKKDIREDK